MDIWNPIKEAFAVKGSLLGIVSLLLVGAGAGYFVSHERMTAKDEKLSMKDEELKQCRGRVDFLYAPTLKVNGITSADLRAKTLQVATGLRYVLSEYRRRIDSALQQRPVSADEMQRPFSYVIEQFHSRFKADAILIRDEILLRLSPEDRRSVAPSRPFLYENPTNTLGVEDVATNLEVLARKLGDY
jgi:hypothetical protein